MTKRIKLPTEAIIRSAFISYMEGTATDNQKEVLDKAKEDPKMFKLCQDLEVIWGDPEKKEILLLNPTSKKLPELTDSMLHKQKESVSSGNF